MQKQYLRIMALAAPPRLSVMHWIDPLHVIGTERLSQDGFAGGDETGKAKHDDCKLHRCGSPGSNPPGGDDSRARAGRNSACCQHVHDNVTGQGAEDVQLFGTGRC
jgi:hypothetical protein